MPKDGYTIERQHVVVEIPPGRQQNDQTTETAVIEVRDLADGQPAHEWRCPHSMPTSGCDVDRPQKPRDSEHAGESGCDCCPFRWGRRGQGPRAFVRKSSEPGKARERGRAARRLHRHTPRTDRRWPSPQAGPDFRAFRVTG